MEPIINLPTRPQSSKDFITGWINNDPGFQCYQECMRSRHAVRRGLENSSAILWNAGVDIEMRTKFEEDINLEWVGQQEQQCTTGHATVLEALDELWRNWNEEGVAKFNRTIERLNADRQQVLDFLTYLTFWAISLSRPVNNSDVAKSDIFNTDPPPDSDDDGSEWSESEGGPDDFKDLGRNVD